MQQLLLQSLKYNPWDKESEDPDPNRVVDIYLQK